MELLYQSCNAFLQIFRRPIVVKTDYIKLIDLRRAPSAASGRAKLQKSLPCQQLAGQRLNRMCAASPRKYLRQELQHNLALVFWLLFQ